MSEVPSWHIVGDWFDNCSCAVPCPCTFAQAPDNGFCESVLFWHVREGHYGDVKLDNLSFLRVGRWEGDLWAKKASGVAGLYIDDHADDRQMEALPAIIGGRAGGFPRWGKEGFGGGRQSRGIERAKITYEIAPNLGHWGVEIVGTVKAWAKAIIGPTSPPGKYPQLMNAPGSETGPGSQLVTWGKSTILSVDGHGFKFEYTLTSTSRSTGSDPNLSGALPRSLTEANACQTSGDERNLATGRRIGSRPYFPIAGIAESWPGRTRARALLPRRVHNA